MGALQHWLWSRSSAGLTADLDLAGRAIKGQMKQADRFGARYALILDDGRATLRDMSSGEEREVDPDRIAEEIMRGRSAGEAEK